MLTQGHIGTAQNSWILKCNRITLSASKMKTTNIYAVRRQTSWKYQVREDTQNIVGKQSEQI
jgi:hypothetical protein